MTRKRKASELKTSSSDHVSAQHGNTTSSARSASAETKPKVDWSTIDQRKDFDGFKVLAVKLKPNKEAAKPVVKKQKTTLKASRASEIYKQAPLSAQVSQENPFPETDLSEIYCKIEPALEWESTQRYRKFTISGEGFEVNQFVFVKKEPEKQDTPEAIEHWIAKVLEVRAGNTQHVYLRVYWAYRPEDLPGGRQPHHGECELIVSNHMDVVDAQCVQGAAHVIYWDDSPDSSKFPAPEQLYWRQSLDINKRKGFQVTKLNTYCVDKKPSNPDEPLIQCPSCSCYLHARCIEERAGKAAYDEHKAKQRTNSTKDKHAWRNSFKVELSITDTDEPRLTVVDKRKGKNNIACDVDIHCLSCGALIAKANANPPIPKTPASQIVDDDEIEEDEKDASIIPDASSPGAPLDEANLAIGDIPTPATTDPTSAPAAVQAPRGRGRPKGSKNKPRGRPPIIKTEDVEDEDMTSLVHQDENIGANNIIEQNSVKKEVVSQNMITPPPAPESTSVFQTGVESVKRLLFKP
ncbi:hypothetical protein J1614_002841 [Plenodomus biglobosus]|nr:hypothetical protein J1614_002841 [Plenodomus biglobosus]